MRSYKVVLVPQAQRQIKEIYGYILEVLKNPAAAQRTVDAIKDAVMSLKTMPERGHLRQTGPFADGRHRTLRVNNYLIVYTVEEKTVYVLAIHYAARNM